MRLATTPPHAVASSGPYTPFGGAAGNPNQAYAGLRPDASDTQW